MKDNVNLLSLHFISKYIKNPIIKLYFEKKWFFDRFSFQFSHSQMRIYGPGFLFSNLKMKIQTIDAPYCIYNENGAEKVKTIDYKNIKSSKPIEVLDRQIQKTRIIKIHEMKSRFYGINFRIFKHIQRHLENSYKLKDSDIECKWYQNRSVLFLYLKIQKINLEMILPTRKFKKEREK